MEAEQRVTQGNTNSDVHLEHPGDPSHLTTQLLLREVSSLKELMQSKFASVEKGIAIAHDDLVRFPTEVQKAVGALQVLLETKIGYENKLTELHFKHIEDKFAWVEKTRVEQKTDNATSIEAALKAAKEAVTEQNNSNVLARDKSEQSFTKLIDQLALLITTLGKTLDDKIADVKDRVITSTSTSSGKTAGATNVMDIIKFVLVVGGFVLTYFVAKNT